MTVFVTKFNYIKLIEKFPVTSDKTKSFSSFSNPPGTELEIQALNNKVKWATDSLSTALPSPQVPGDDPSAGLAGEDNSAIDLTRSA